MHAAYGVQGAYRSQTNPYGQSVFTYVFCTGTKEEGLQHPGTNKRQTVEAEDIFSCKKQCGANDAKPNHTTINLQFASLPFARVCRVGVWFGFVGAALLPAVGTFVVLAFGAMPGRCCFLRVT